MKHYKGEEVKPTFLLENGLLVIVVPQKLSDVRSGQTSCSRVRIARAADILST